MADIVTEPVPPCIKCKANPGSFGYRGKYKQYNYNVCGICRKQLVSVAKDNNKTELEILIEYERKIKW